MINLKDGELYLDACFERLNLVNSSLKGIEFDECHFSECDFSESQFNNCKFINCEFERCNLSLINLSNSRLFSVTFKESKLVGIDWTRAIWAVYHTDFELKFERCVLNDSSFFGLTLNELYLEECRLHDVDFREGNFVDSVITYCDLSHSLFMHTNLEGVDFSESTNFVINVLENRVKRAKFTRYEALNLLESLGIELVD